jgi:thioredoxin-related protein
VAIVLHTDGQDDKYFESSKRNARLQFERFGTRANPHYVLLDPTGKEVYAERGGVFTAEELIEFLRQVPAH